MSGNAYAHDAGVADDLFGKRDGKLFSRVLLLRVKDNERSDSRAPLHDEADMSLFKRVPRNVVQSIWAFRVQGLAREAQRLGHHFLYANCAAAQTKGEVLDTIASSFLMTRDCGKNYQALYESLTHVLSRAGSQPGFVIVLEGLPVAQKFDKDARETLLEQFRDAAEYWEELKIPFRVFYSFSQ